MTSDKNASYTDIHPPEPGGEGTPSDLDTSPGQLLARRREALGLSVQQVADDLHLTMHYVRALEADAHEKLPGVVFIRGYIRAYASYLKLDPTVLVNVFNEFINQRDGTGEEASHSISRRRRDRNRPWIVISGIAFVAIAVALWYVGTGAGAPVATPAAAPATATAPATLNNAASRPTAAVSATSATPPAASTATPAPAPVANVGLPVPAPTGSTPFTSTPVAAAPEPAIDTIIAPAAAGSAAPVAAADSNAAPVTQATAAAISGQPAATATPAATVAPAAVTAPAATTTPAATSTPVATATPAATAAPAASAAPAPDAQAAAQAVQRVAPTQVITVDAGGSDLVEILFSGESLVQIDDGSARQIYREIRAAGDHLRVNGTGPFNVLLGDAATAELHLNGKKIDFTESIRIDNSARLTIGL